MCQHLADLSSPRREAITPGTQGCKECLRLGSTWVHLRLCMSCGHVGCCDSSPNRHATRHFHATHHPVVRSFEPGEDWAWCYRDEEMAEGVPYRPGEAPAEHLAAPGQPG